MFDRRAVQSVSTYTHFFMFAFFSAQLCIQSVLIGLFICVVNKMRSRKKNSKKKEKEKVVILQK